MNIKNDDFFAYFEFMKKIAKNTFEERYQQKNDGKIEFLTFITV
jgi:hypothetical protein